MESKDTLQECVSETWESWQKLTTPYTEEEWNTSWRTQAKNAALERKDLINNSQGNLAL